MPGKGLQNIPLRIPANWDPVWFESFVREVLALADARNVIEGPGIEVTGNSDVAATFSTSDDIQQLKDQSYVVAQTSAFLANERVLAGESGVIDIDDGGAGSDITVSIIDHSIFDSKIRESLPVSVIGRDANSSGEVADIEAAANDTVLARVTDALAFQQLTVGMAPNDLWTYAKIQNVSATDRILGRDTAAAGDIEELTVSGGLEFTGGPGIQRSALTGDVTASAGSNATTVANNAVTYAKMQDVSAASKLLGRGSSSGAGDPEEITVGTGLTMTGTTLSSSGGTGACTFINETSLGAAATTLTVGSLDLDTDQGYLVYLTLDNATAGTFDLSLFFNADTTATNYDCQRASVGATTFSAARANNAILVAALPANQSAFLKLEIRRTPDGAVHCIVDGSAANTTAIVRVWTAHQWRTTATNVTGITFSSSVATAIAANSRARVFRIHT